MHHFAAQLQPAQQTTLSLRASQYRPAGKRKRIEDDAEDPLPSSNTQSQPPLDSLETAQLRVAGLLPGDEFDIPSPPFPHAPVRTSSEGFNSTKLQKELAGLDPPLFAIKASSQTQPIDRKSERPALRQTHLGVLSSMMHKCLLEGDYHRAARAWGLILRSQIAGLPIDPRNHGRWGIGAELLLRRDAHNPPERRQDSQDGSGNSTGEQFPSDVDALYTQQGFELAREYYERLIVQHPNRKHLQHSVDDRTFYPAMFSLWIYEVCEKSRRKQRNLKDDIHDSTSRSVSFDEDTTMASDSTRARIAAIREEELREAGEIAQRMDQLVASPPFDKHAHLLQLRGMVGLWVSDLMLNADYSEDEIDERDTNERREEETEEHTSERRWRISESINELTESQGFFNRAQANGQATMASVEAKIRDLTNRMTKLRH